MTKLEIQSDVKPFTMIKNAIIDSEEILNEHEKMLYIVLLRYGNKAFPSLSTLSKKCGFSKSTAQRSIDALIEKGLLKKKNRVSKKTGNTSNVYTLIDNDKIWYSSKENMEENIETARLEEAVKLVEAAGMKVIRKENGLVSEPAKVTDTSTQQNKLSVDKDNTARAKSQGEEYTMQDVQALFDYSILMADYPEHEADLNVVFDILHEVLNTSKQTIRIGGEDKPKEVVKGKLMKLESYDIVYAIDKFHEQIHKIKNTRAYLLTILYHAREQSYLDLMNLGHRNGDF